MREKGYFSPTEKKSPSVRIVLEYDALADSLRMPRHQFRPQYRRDLDAELQSLGVSPE